VLLFSDRADLEAPFISRTIRTIPAVQAPRRAIEGWAIVVVTALLARGFLADVP
jgi:hypothetical protein